MNIKTREICIYGILGTLIFVLKIMMAPLPNIEPVSLLIIIYTITFGAKSIYPIATYMLLEIIFYGFGFWSIGYLYVWLFLDVIVFAIYNMKHSTNVLLWACVSGIYGLMFGALYIPLYLISGGITMAISWWISGIYYDIIHCVANFALCLALFKPLTQLMFKLNKQYKIN